MLALLKKIYGKLTYSYKNRLSLIFSLCILVPMLFLFIIGFNSFEKNSINYTEDAINTKNGLLTEKFNSAFDALYNKTVYLLNSDELHYVINTAGNLTLSERIDVNDVILRTKMFYSPDALELFRIYTTNESLKDINYIEAASENEINKLCGSDELKTVIEEINGTEYLSVYRKWTRNSGNNGYSHVVSVSTPLSKIFNERASENKNFSFFHKKGTELKKIILPADENAPDFYKYQKNGRLKNYIVKETPSPQTDGVFFTFMDIAEENRKINIIKLTFVIAYIFLTALVIFIMHCLSLKLTDSLTSIISDIELDNIKKPMDKKGKVKEFEIIHNKLYELSEKLSDMMKMELQTLSEKIAPHFLYNNLSAIKMIYSDEKLETVVNTLIEYYRNAFQKSETYVSLKNELENLKTYVSLLKFAYDQDFSYLEETDENILNNVILSGLIQPIIENAFIHSINNSDEADAFIKIKIKEEKNFIEISVINNHCDEPVEVLTESAERKDNSSALSIIRKRIKLYYNDDAYGISFKKLGDVLYTTLRLPKKTQNEL